MLLFPDALDAPRLAPDQPGSLVLRLGPTLLLVATGTRQSEDGRVLLLHWRLETPSFLPEAATPSYTLPESGFSFPAGDVPIPEAAALVGCLRAEDVAQALRAATGTAARAHLRRTLVRAAAILPAAFSVRIVPHPNGVALFPHEPAGLSLPSDVALGGPEEGRALGRLRILDRGEFRRLQEVVLALPRTAHDRLSWQDTPISP